MTALFFAVIGMIYHQAGTRDVRYLGGLMKIIPFLSVGYAVAGLANLGLPGFAGFRSRDDHLRRFFPECRYIPSRMYHHRMYLNRSNSGLHPALCW